MDLNHALLALADPTRRAIVERLAEGERSASELAAPFGLSQPTISHHLKVLLEGGIVVKRNEGTRRIYNLDRGAVGNLDAWLARLKATMELNYQRLDTLLADMEKNQ
ncbi:ArsR/SmtB family transcription factor [Pseudoxanthomonas sp. 10H]|uniref:ArsR/SmtB family transcription factor n=1 Tax=Pseudoxanthomonas sp. 10H TaxID=3242729 RepID=UPI0035560FE4